MVSVLAGAEPFSADGGEVGVLLCHGFTGSPQSMRPWAHALAESGFTVRVPRLPGHGTNWKEMNTTTWDDWTQCVESAFLALRERTPTVVAGGLSMGGSLALNLAERHPYEVKALALVNPAVKAEDPRLALLPVLKHVIPSLPGIASDIALPGATELAYDRTPLKALHSMMGGWKQVVAQLGTVTCPVTIYRSPQDHVVPASSTALIRERIGSTDVTEVLCENSYHVATLDHDADLIASDSIGFFRRVLQLEHPA